MLRSEILTRWGVMLIFFFQGLTLSLTVLRSGVMQWRLHLFVQSFVFGIIPLLALVMIASGGDRLPEALRIGFLLLAVLPTTIATNVAYTALSGGNVAGAVFSSTLANFAGIFITPLWISLWLQVSGEALPLGKLFFDISRMLLAPLLLGQMCRPLLRKKIDASKKYFSITSSLIILFIVHAAFCNSWKSNVWSAQGTQAVALAAAGAATLFVVTMGLVYLGIRVFRFERGNAVAAGVPLAKLIFAAHPGLGLILPPLMLYHPLQLLADGLLVHRLNKKRA